MRKLFCVVLISILLSSLVIAGEVEKLVFGSYEVGFEVSSHNDISRNSRNITKFLWYPAIIKSTDRNTIVSDYLNHDFSISGSKKKQNHVLNQKTHSYLNAERLQEDFPVIVIGQGYNYESVASQAILAEYLASYGFIVVSCPLKGTDIDAVKLNIEDVETQVKDLHFVLAETLNEYGNNSKTGVVGFDLGGLSAALFAMNNSDVDCVVSLDGGLIFNHNLDLIKQSSYYNPAQLKVPLMQITRIAEGNRRMGITEDFSLFENSKHSVKYLLRFENIAHSEFTNYNILGFEKKGDDRLLLYNGKINEAVPVFFEFVLHFLTASLKNDEKSMDLMINNSALQSNTVPVTLEIFKSEN